MAEKRTFPLGVLLTATTGRLLAPGSFGEFHGFVEFLTSGPVWTHEFDSHEFYALLKREVLRQHPDLPTEADIDADTWKPWLADAVATYGPSRDVEPIPDYRRTKGPLETLAEIAPDKPVIVLATPTEGAPSNE